MPESHEELLDVAYKMSVFVQRGKHENIQKPLERLKSTAEKTQQCWSGSWIGYHANVYYRDLQPPPRGAHFSPEWGLMGGLGTDTTGDWQEFDTTDVQTAVRNLADNPDFGPCLALQEEAIQEFEAHRPDVISILDISIELHPDRFLERSKAELENLSTTSRNEIVRRLSPGGQLMTRDTLALTQGLRTHRTSP